MAGIKYQCEFYTNNNARYRINIYHVDYSSTTVEFKGGIEGFTLKYEGANDPLYKAIKASTLEFDFQVEEDPTSVGTPTTGNIYEDLLLNNESKLFVIVEHYDYPDTAWRTWWAGDIIDDTVTIADAPLPTTIRIRATDGIAKLKQKIYAPETGASWLCVLYYFQTAIEQTLYYSTAFPSSGGTATIPIRNTANRYNVAMGDVSDTTWKDTYNPYKLAFVNEAAFQNDDGTWMTYYDIIDQLATLYGVQFFMSAKEFQNLGVTWWLMSRSVMYNEPLSTVASSCRVFENQAYTSGGDALTPYEYCVPNTSTLSTALDVTQEVGLDLSVFRPKLKGNKISYYSPLGQVQTNYFHDLMSYPLNMSFENATNDISQYTNITGQIIGSGGGYASLLGFFGDSGSLETNDPLNSPYFPAGMSYTGTDTTYGTNNDGWFIPVTDGQDTIIISGTLTISYKFSWSGAYAAFTAQLSGENSYIDTSFRLPIIFRIVTSNKSSADYAQAQIDDVNLGDVEMRRWLNGTYGSGGGNAATWSSTVPNWGSNWESSTIKIMVDNPPLENDEQMTITVPFSFVSEPLPDLHAGQDYLKRTQFEVGELTVGNVFQGQFEDLIDGDIVDIENFNVTLTDFQQAYIFNGSQISNYFGTSIGRYNNYNTDASSRMDIKPDFFIGDPPWWVSTEAGGTNPANLSPAQYFGGIRIFAPSAADPTTTAPNQLQTNAGEWRTTHDSVEKEIHKLLCREIVKKRCFPIYKYDIKFQIIPVNGNLGQLYNIGFWNTLKINMRLNENQSDDIRGFFPTGGTYTAVTNTWHLTVQQMDVNTESNIEDTSYNEVNNEPFLNNPNVFYQAEF